MPYIHIAAEPDLNAPRATKVEVGRWYPQMPPMLLFETVDQYTNRLIGARGVRPYDHHRNRQCSIGFHNECTLNGCECPCHA